MVFEKHKNSCIQNPIVKQQRIKICPVCNKEFHSKSTTCSYSCSNKMFHHSKEGGSKYKCDEILLKSDRYRDLCFRYHGKKCIICDESNILSVHHLNENHFDNRPENLIPLCPTHHQYWHSSYKNLIETKIYEYIIKWKHKNIK